MCRDHMVIILNGVRVDLEYLKMKGVLFGKRVIKGKGS